MLNKQERLAIQRHSARISAYEKTEDAERARLGQPTAKRVQELFDKSSQAIGPPDFMGVFTSRGYTSEEHREVLAIYDLIQRGISQFAIQNKPNISPWGTPNKLLSDIDSDLCVYGAVHRIHKEKINGYQESEYDVKIRELYRKFRGRLLAFSGFARSVLCDFPEASDPHIGIQDIRWWCKDAIADSTLLRKQRRASGNRNVVPKSTSFPNITQQIVSLKKSNRRMFENSRISEMKESSDRRNRWTNNILSAPTTNNATVREIAQELRKAAAEYLSSRKPQSGFEALVMDFVGESVRHGAFGGPAWIGWRTKLAASPNSSNAVLFAEYPPSPFAMPSLPLGRRQPFDAANILADLMESFTSEAPLLEVSIKKAGGRGRRKGSLKSDPNIDANMYKDWKASDSKIADFSRSRNLPEADVRGSIGRHKKRRQSEKK